MLWCLDAVRKGAWTNFAESFLTSELRLQAIYGLANHSTRNISKLDFPYRLLNVFSNSP